MSNNIFNDTSLLYVEDEPLISLDAMSFLETCGFQNLDCAYTLKSAVSLADQKRFDCAILDIRLERGLSSIEFGKSLIEKGTLVVLASGNGLDKIALKDQGFHRFFIKPYDIKEVVASLALHFSKLA